MKFTLTAIILLAICFLAAVCSAQTTTGFQSVGGDFGKTWINNFKAQNTPPAEQDLKQDLWNWGGAPKGKKLVGGKLVDAVNDTNKINFTANWLGDTSGVTPIYFNSSSPYGNYGLNPNNPSQYNAAPLTPLALSDDPWILAQQLDRPVVTPNGYYTPF